jgi:hypothetical protein
MRNFAIKLTKENRKEVKDWFNKYFPNQTLAFTCYDSYYGVVNGRIKVFLTIEPTSSEIIYSISELEEVKKFPRLMYHKLLNEERMVLGKFGIRYVYIIGDYANQIETNEMFYTTNSQESNFKEIEEIKIPESIEVTIDDIAKLMNVDAKLIKIKK